ncbi:acetolactate synthase 2 small subunit [Photorhabdus sp. CRCIA-P01]|uniref:acetolactate synthase 2 small subunit n=1 Tax=Photorhabdus sp. CRCIA-P01 TaxID=2019570 RepID=UPI000E59A050|nr:acetolactate synthase 2 small subunit [Photorhabdus sp. CRCIA-P01]
MMQHQLAIHARFRPEILERILRVTRHRGFRICSMNMDQTMDGDNVNIELIVASQKPVNLLSSQLTKLVDVAGVKILQKKSQLIRA